MKRVCFANQQVREKANGISPLMAGSHVVYGKCGLKLEKHSSAMIPFIDFEATAVNNVLKSNKDTLDMSSRGVPDADGLLTPLAVADAPF